MQGPWATVRRISFWLPAGLGSQTVNAQLRIMPLSHGDLLCVLSPGFAKKTFISYVTTFKESFRQGLVVKIDLKNQTVLLEDGEVSTVAFRF